MMFSKAVLAFLAIGTLWLNVSATPIPPPVERGSSSTSDLTSGLGSPR